MPAKKKTNPKKSLTKKQPNSRFSKKTTLFVIVVVLAAVLPPAWITYSNYKDKKRFTDAEQTISQVYDAIVSRVGKPINVNRENSCSRPSLKFETGSLSCGVSINFTYNIESLETANDTVKNINSVGDDQLNRLELIQSKQNKTTPFVPILNDHAIQTTSREYKPAQSDLHCSLSYRYENTNKQKLQVELACDGPAKNKYYPEKN